MEQIQVQKLKINATNIRNTLTGYNKQLRKLRVEESRYSFISEKRRKIEAEEKRLEKGPIQKSTEWLKSRIVSAPMSFLDKLKEFFGIVLLGLIINNLPKIIAQLKQFFSDNKWLIDVVKFTISAIADGVMGIIWLVTKYPKAVQQNMMKELKKVQDEIDKVIAIANGAYSIWNNFLNPKQTPTKTTPSPPMAAPGSMYPAQTPQSASPPSQSTASPNPQSSNQPSQPLQKFAKGGTVKGGQTSRIGRSFRGATPTAMGRKAIESTNAFETFGTVASDARINSSILGGRDGVTDNFDKVNQSLEQFLKVLKGEDTGKPPGPPSPPGAPYIPPKATRPGPGGVTTPGGIKVDPGDVLGTVGSTGRSYGPHLHIETGDGYGGAGGTIPKNVLDNVFIGGVPLSKLSQGDGLGAGRNHRGFDFPANSGTSVTIGGNLKFLEYDEGYNAGYGNSLIIVDENGNKYLLGHLSSGPTAEALKKIKDKKKSKVEPQKVSRKIGQVPDETSLAMNAVDFFVTQVIEKPVPFPQLIRVNSSGESTNNSVPEINPLLLV